MSATVIPIAKPAAFAADPVCNTNTGPSSAVKYSVSVTTKDALWAHKPVYFTLAPGTSGSRTLSQAITITASITVSAGVSAEAGVVFAKASATAGVALMAAGSRTDTDSITLSATNSKSTYQDFVLFDGTRHVAGAWTKYKCTYSGAYYSWVKVGNGTYTSWDAQYAMAINCADDAVIKTRYGTWSIQYKAVTSC